MNDGENIIHLLQNAQAHEDNINDPTPPYHIYNVFFKDGSMSQAYGFFIVTGSFAAVVQREGEFQKFMLCVPMTEFAYFEIDDEEDEDDDAA